MAHRTAERRVLTDRIFMVFLTVELADKTLPVVMFKELWKDGGRKFHTIEDVKHITFLGPRDEMLDRLVLYHPT